MSVINNKILGSRVDPTSYALAVQQVLGWACHGESRFVCVASVNNIMEAYDSLEFRDMVNSADLVTPDGMPLVWMLRRLGYTGQSRVYGPDLTLKIIDAAAMNEIAIGFYGGTAETLELLKTLFLRKYPHLKIAYSYSPPFRSMTAEEEDAITRAVNASGAKILFIGLGCPKQERWIALRKGKIQAVMLGVGASFDFLSGKKRQAPLWMQRAGLEWLFRFSQEPTRLWRRYLYHNPRFLALSLLQLTGLSAFDK